MRHKRRTCEHCVWLVVTRDMVLTGNMRRYLALGETVHIFK